MHDKEKQQIDPSPVLEPWGFWFADGNYASPLGGERTAKRVVDKFIEFARDATQTEWKLTAGETTMRMAGLFYVNSSDEAVRRQAKFSDGDGIVTNFITEIRKRGDGWYCAVTSSKHEYYFDGDDFADKLLLNGSDFATMWMTEKLARRFGK